MMKKPKPNGGFQKLNKLRGYEHADPKYILWTPANVADDIFSAIIESRVFTSLEGHTENVTGEDLIDTVTGDMLVMDIEDILEKVILQ